MEKKYGSGGAMFTRDKRSANAPDYGGDFVLEGDVLDYVMRKAEQGEEVKLEISSWLRNGRNNTRFLSLSVQVPYQERQQTSGFQTTRGTFPSQAPRRTRAEPVQEEAPRRRRVLDDDIPF